MSSKPFPERTDGVASFYSSHQVQPIEVDTRNKLNTTQKTGSWLGTWTGRYTEVVFWIFVCICCFYCTHSWVVEDWLMEMPAIQKCQSLTKGPRRFGFCSQKTKKGAARPTRQTSLGPSPSILAKGHRKILPSVPLQLSREVPSFPNRTDPHQDILNTRRENRHYQYKEEQIK